MARREGVESETRNQKFKRRTEKGRLAQRLRRSNRTERGHSKAHGIMEAKRRVYSTGEGGVTWQMLLRCHVKNSKKQVVGTLGGGREEGQQFRRKRKVTKEGHLISGNQLWKGGENSGIHSGCCRCGQIRGRRNIQGRSCAAGEEDQGLRPAQYSQSTDKQRKRGSERS